MKLPIIIIRINSLKIFFFYELIIWRQENIWSYTFIMYLIADYILKKWVILLKCYYIVF